MKRLILALFALALVGAPLASFAEDAPPTAAPAPDWTFPVTLTLTSDYIFRGLTQTDESPAFQPGIEVDHASGFYVGAWASNIKWLHDYNKAASANVEIDVYTGIRNKINDDWSYDVGLYTYYYPGDYPKNAGYTLPYTTEIYGQLSYHFVSLKYSHALTNLFGFYKTKNSGYLDLSANWEFVPTWVLNAHIGRQKVDGFDIASYTDYKLGVTKSFDGGWSLALAWFDTNADRSTYTFLNGDYQGRSTGVLSLAKTF